MKPLVFLGSSLKNVQAMPAAVRHALGFDLMMVQFGDQPSDLRMTHAGKTPE